jgi:hypothetical protein
MRRFPALYFTVVGAFCLTSCQDVNYDGTSEESAVSSQDAVINPEDGLKPSAQPDLPRQSYLSGGGLELAAHQMLQIDLLATDDRLLAYVEQEDVDDALEAKMQQIFQQYDTNDNDFIDAEEYQLFLDDRMAKIDELLRQHNGEEGVAASGTDTDAPCTTRKCSREYERQLKKTEHFKGVLEGQYQYLMGQKQLLKGETDGAYLSEEERRNCNPDPARIKQDIEAIKAEIMARIEQIKAGLKLPLDPEKAGEELQRHRIWACQQLRDHLAKIPGAKPIPLLEAILDRCVNP